MSVTGSLEATVETLCGDLSSIRAPRGIDLHARAFVRSLSPRLRDDRPLAGDIETVAAAVRDGSLAAAVEAEVGELA